MIKRSLYFGSPAYLSMSQLQLVYRPKDGEVKTIPIEDLGYVILDHPQITISQPLMTELLNFNVALITCDAKHLPQGLMLNLDGHHTQQAHFAAQVNATTSLKARMWKYVVQQKIRNQAAFLSQIGVQTDNMNYWAKACKNGDPENLEGRAAAYYWKKLFDDNFKRGRFEEGPNALLNYGYAILRAAVARSLVGSGLHPSLGIHHHNKYNAYCLADDLMEPYRPFVDQLVLQIMASNADWESMSREIKAELLTVPLLDVGMGASRRPLMLAVQQTTASLANVYLGDAKHLKLPKWLN